MIAEPTYLAWGVGSVVLALELVGVGAVAVAARRRLVAEVRGAEARLVEFVLAVTAALIVGWILGSIGWLRPVPVALTVLAVGLVAARDLRRAPRQPASGFSLEPIGQSTHTADPPAPTTPLWFRIGVGAAVVVVSLAWLVQVACSYRRGIYDGDSLWYHQPIAARFVQTGWITHIQFLSGDPLVTFFPANSELLHALTILPFGNDGIVPLINLGWLAFMLLTGWVAGERYGRGPAGLLIATGICALPVVLLTQAGTARNDLMGYALLSAGLVLGIDHDRDRGRAVVVAMALGLAVGVKVSLLAPVALVLLTLLFGWWFAARRRSIPASATAVTVFVVMAAPWYIRNWVRIGNPFPWLGLHLGPIRFERTPLPSTTLSDSSLVHRFDEPGWWSDLVRPGFVHAFGLFWWALLAASVVAIVLGTVGSATARRTATARIAALAAVLAVAAYVVTPNSAPLPVGQFFARMIFSFNTRYLVPALLIALLSAIGTLSARPLHALSLAVGVGGLVALVPRRIHDNFQWHSTGRDVLFALVGVALVIALFAAVALGVGWWGGRSGVVMTVVVAIVAVLASGVVVRHHLAARWRQQPAPFVAAATWTFGDDIENARIGVVGDYFQYPYTGRTGTNYVQYIGVPGPHGTFRDAETCAEWRAAVAKADVDYLVVVQQIFSGPNEAGPPTWTASDPTAHLLRTDVGGQVYQLTAKEGLDGCS
jgi:hypothetical protein